jgi:hypothetical protein
LPCPDHLLAFYAGVPPEALLQDLKLFLNIKVIVVVRIDFAKYFVHTESYRLMVDAE